jgi:hypothetical protein
MPSFLRFCVPILLGSSACGSCGETSTTVQREYVAREREAFVFEVPRDKLIAELRGVLADRGDELVEADPAAATLHTKLRRDHDYVIHIIELRQGCVVHIIHRTFNGAGEVLEGRIADDLEWELAQRAEPDRAIAIMREANTRADKVPVRGP